jgi:hypothetical protein
MIYRASIDNRLSLYVGGREFFNAYRVDTNSRRISYYVNKSNDPFDRESPVKLHPRRKGLVHASIVVPRGQLKIVRDRRR